MTDSPRRAAAYRPLTKRQEAVLRMIVAYIAENGYVPSIREIGKHFDIASLRGVTTHLDAIERKGYIERNNTPRSIRILHPAYTSKNTATMVPLLKGYDHDDLLGECNIEKLYPVAANIVAGSPGAFLVKITGAAMNNYGLLPHDLAVCIPQASYRNLDLVAFGLRESETLFVRRLTERNDGSLQLGDETVGVPGADQDNVRILGHVVGMMRDYEGEAF